MTNNNHRHYWSEVFCAALAAAQTEQSDTCGFPCTQLSLSPCLCSATVTNDAICDLSCPHGRYGGSAPFGQIDPKTCSRFNRLRRYIGIAVYEIRDDEMCNRALPGPWESAAPTIRCTMEDVGWLINGAAHYAILSVRMILPTGSKARETTMGGEREKELVK